MYSRCACTYVSNPHLSRELRTVIDRGAGVDNVLSLYDQHGDPKYYAIILTSLRLGYGYYR